MSCWIWSTVLWHTPTSAAAHAQSIDDQHPRGKQGIELCLLSTWGRPVWRLSWMAFLPSQNALTHPTTMRYGSAAIDTCFAQSLKIFLCTKTSYHLNFDPGTLLYFVNMILGHSFYPYESQRSTHCSGLTEYCHCWLHYVTLTVLAHVHKAGSSRTHHRHVAVVLPVLLSNLCILFR